MSQLAVPPRILVADDNPPSLRFFADALTASGIDCVEAADGIIALELAGREAFDLLLLDARMPGASGAQVLADVRARIGPSQHAIALATTASSDASAHAVLRGAGFAEVLVKPLTIGTLRTVLDRYLPARVSQADDDRSEWLDDGQALVAAGGDLSIAAALRVLLVRELEQLPVELAVIGERHDVNALHERLHRFDASAGFCGVPVLARAASALRAELDASEWPQEAITGFLRTCDSVRTMLDRVDSGRAADGSDM